MPNENKILVTLRITVYAFSQTVLRKSGPGGAADVGELRRIGSQRFASAEQLVVSCEIWLTR
jgi:hypothetical protein